MFEVLQASKSRELVPLGMAVADPALFPTPSSAGPGSCMRRLDPFSTVADLPGNGVLRRAIARRYADDGLAVGSLKDHHHHHRRHGGALPQLAGADRTGRLGGGESPTFYGALQAIERLQAQRGGDPVRPGVGIDLALLAQALAERPIKACWLMGQRPAPAGPHHAG